MKKILVIIFAVIAIMLLIGSIASLSDQHKDVGATSDATSNLNDSLNKNSPEVKKETWAYSEEDDKINDDKKYFARVLAKEELEFKFPYQGGSTAAILLRKRNGKKDAMITISKGQFMANNIDESYMKIKFDDQKAEKYSFSEPSDGSSTVIFINNTSKFISKLKHSKRVLIECEFYDEGLRTMEFNTEGLKW